MHALKAENLSVTLGNVGILRELDFELSSGSWVGIIGPNGSGKTTLLRTISGNLAYKGSMKLDDKELSAWPSKELARILTFMRQKLALHFDLTVNDFVMLGRLPYQRWLGNPSQEDQHLVDRILKELQLEEFKYRSVNSLSGGEHQRMMLAQSLVQDARILLLDEPTAHVDIHYQFSFLERISEIVKQGALVLSVFHDLELAARYCDYLIVLHDGSISAKGKPDKILNQDLIKRVFRMNSNVTSTQEGYLHIRYHKSIEQK